ncbi:MAG: CvpA family protein, partial [Oscillospiraceae bacterium]
SLAMDLVALGIIVNCVVIHYKRGFLRSVLRYFGNIAILHAAIFGARAAAPVVFRQFFAKTLETRMAALISENAVHSTRQLLDSLVGFLPEATLEPLTATLEDSLNFAAPDIAQQAVDHVLAPFITPIIAVVLFFVLFIVLWVALKLVSLALKGVSALPVVGTVNRLLGGVAGVLIAFIYIFLLLCAVWAYDWMVPDAPLGPVWFSRSLVWKLLSPANIFSFFQ